MKIQPSYQKPFVFALGLHVVLLIILIVKLPSWHYQYEGGGPQVKVVQATTVTATQVQQTMQAINAREQAHQQEVEDRLTVLKQQVEREKAQQQAQQQQALVEKQRQQQELQRLVVLKQEQLKHLEELRTKQEAEAALAALQQKKRDEIKIAEKKAAQKKANSAAQKLKALAARQRQLQEKMLAQQLAGETSQVKSDIQTTQMQGLVDKYKALIVAAIGQQWLVPSGVSKNLSVVYEIELAPGGVVLSVQLVKSSGNLALDQSAETAIYKASPLPVPKDPVAFDNFRDLHLTVSPKQIVNS